MRTITSKRESRLSLVEEIEFNPAGRDTVHPQGSFTLPVQRLRQFVRFCLVGGSGVVVDMGVLSLLADPKMLALNVAISKVCAAEVALVNNFVWNELWTFKGCGKGRARHSVRAGLAGGESDAQRTDAPCLRSSRLRRFFFFNAICGLGIVFAVLLLHLFHSFLGWNLYLSNLLTIILVTVWNFGMNARFNWRLKT
ncbi:MAG: GtrA family protein [Verrucomicrobiae bacterium]|nr:GtrA family protein [Verrucomicrobiae bacterium]